METELPSFEESTFGALLDQLSDGVLLAKPEPWRVAYVNKPLSDWLERAAEELLGALVEDLVEPSTRAELLELADRVFRGAASNATMTGQLKAGSERAYAAEIRFCRVCSAELALLGLVVRRDEAARPAATAGSSRTDPLTGLADREFLMQQLAARLRYERSQDNRFALLFIDLDNFKQVNDAHGHLIGDRVLREVAHRLSGCVREGDHVARFGGDEFVVLVDDVAGAGAIEPLTQRIRDALGKPFAIPAGEFKLSLSIGAAEASPDHQSPEDLLRDADRAMYASKRARAAPGEFPATN